MNSGPLKVSTFAMGLAMLIAPTIASAMTIYVNPGDSLQAKINAASAGDKLLVLPGTYQESTTGGPAITITKSLTLQAKISKAQRDAGQVVRLLANTGQTDGILVKPANETDPDIDGFKIKGFLIEGFQNNGIHLAHVQNFTIDGNESKNNLENGIWPTLSANGQVKRNLSYGSEDSAMWVEASENVRVFKNEVHSAPTGIEVTVSNNIDIYNNNIHDNTTGVGLYHPSAAGLAPLPVMHNWNVYGNWIHDNNAPNTAPPGSLAGSIPAGGGVLVLGVDQSHVYKNKIENNHFYGLATIDYCFAVADTPHTCADYPPAVETLPEHNADSQNTFTDNGLSPDPAHPLAGYAADITYAVLGAVNNCIAGNKSTTTADKKPTIQFAASTPSNYPYPGAKCIF